MPSGPTVFVDTNVLLYSIGRISTQVLNEDRPAINHWDALMVAAAQQQACSYRLTEDLQHGQQIDNLRVVSPFMATIRSLQEPS